LFEGEAEPTRNPGFPLFLDSEIKVEMISRWIEQIYGGRH